MPGSSLVGRLLVATPLIGDDHFRRSVVLLLAHSEEGAMGVVLNRPTQTPAAEILPQWGVLAAAPGVLFVGGPVDRDSVFGVSWAGPVDLHIDPAHMVDQPGEVRLFAGQAGWGPGQVEDEVGQRAWWVVDPEPGDVLTSDPDGLWSRVLRRQPARLSWFANYPEDLRSG